MKSLYKGHQEPVGGGGRCSEGCVPASQAGWEAAWGLGQHEALLASYLAGAGWRGDGHKAFGGPAALSQARLSWQGR